MLFLILSIQVITLSLYSNQSDVHYFFYMRNGRANRECDGTRSDIIFMVMLVEKGFKAQESPFMNHPDGWLALEYYSMFSSYLILQSVKLTDISGTAVTELSLVSTLIIASPSTSYPGYTIASYIQPNIFLPLHNYIDSHS